MAAKIPRPVPIYHHRCSALLGLGQPDPGGERRSAHLDDEHRLQVSMVGLLLLERNGSNGSMFRIADLPATFHQAGHVLGLVGNFQAGLTGAIAAAAGEAGVPPELGG